MPNTERPAIFHQQAKEKEKKNNLLFLRYPCDTIVETAKSTGCDCIVIGSRGLSGIKHMLLGSVSEKVAQMSDIPVLIVK